jgi:AcrR family transcriptional regulator
MKTTRQQQDATRRQILDSAVDLMTRQGFDGTTMKDIARSAGIGDATIYKYFPTKDRIVLGYLDAVVQQALADTLQTPCFADYQLQEKLQRLTDAMLEGLLPDREFVAQVRALARRSPLTLLAEPLAARQALREAVTSFLEAAEAAGEIESCDFKGMAAGLYTDYLAGVVSYWLADTSDEFADTAQLVDLSLGLMVQTLRSGLVNRALQLGGFVLRSQMARLAQHGGSLLGALQMAQRAMGSPPRTATAPAAPPKANATRAPRKPRATTAAATPATPRRKKAA